MPPAATAKKPTKKAPAKKAAPRPKPEPKLIPPEQPSPRFALNVAYIGNFEPPHSTENHVARALENNGHTVTRLQENNLEGWRVAADLPDPSVDFVLWTRTGWGSLDAQLAPLQNRFLLSAHDADLPVVGFHLDIWWGLKRARQVTTEPFFRVPLLITADGGHPEHWIDAGVNHHWMPPAVSRNEAQVGMFRDEFHSKLAFVGSHDGSYHPESQHRGELVEWLKRNFRNVCNFYPQPGRHATRGKDLQDLYASVDVVIGDSCFAGTGLPNYWSDRIPETLGRGGFLLHPRVPGLEDHFSSEVDLRTWDAFNFDQLGELIEDSLHNPGLREMIKTHGRARVLAGHTYERRVEQIIDVLIDKGMLR